MTINIGWEVGGGGHVTKGGGDMAVVKRGAVATFLPSIAPPPTIVIAPFPSIAIMPPSIAPPLPSIATTASANH